jgi:predicted nucleic acid-binding protein
MQAFFDTSAIVPMLITEPHSNRALRAYKAAERVWAWRWMQIEAEAALNRRRAQHESWQQWRILARHIQWLDLESGYHETLCAFNRSLGLRAADAGHLFIFDRAARAITSLKLVTFDDEMKVAANQLGMAVWK